MEKEDLAKKYNIDLKKLEQEQEKLAKHVTVSDSINFDKIEKIGAIDNIFFGKEIVSAIVVLNPQFELIDQSYQKEKIRFPYIPGFRAYRELPAMLTALEKLEEKPQIVLIPGHGISHPRLGLASHFSLASNIPTIGVSKSLIIGEEKDGKIMLGEKQLGVVLKTKESSNPLYISPGNQISIKTAEKIVSKMIIPPHKLPEPLKIAHKYARKIKEETESIS